jgi:hypothetical protein
MNGANKGLNVEQAWAILIDRKAQRKDNREAFIAALIMDRTGAVTTEMTPRIAAAFAGEFVRLARLIKAEAEAACSYERNARQEAADARNQARFQDLAAKLGFEARTGGDPRGACAYLIDPDDRKGDGWGEGWAVYA